MKILCTGNPNKISIAQAVKQKWNQCCCISKSQGWDLLLLNESNQKMFKNLVLDYNVFINSAYVAKGIQSTLLQLVCDIWMEADIKGHIITIGTTAESTASLSDYVLDKQKLRQLSLDLNAKTGITGIKTTYVILGGINDGQPSSSNFVSPESVVNVFEWVLNTPDQIAMLQLEKNQIGV